MTPEQLAEIEARAAAATPGEWEVSNDSAGAVVKSQNGMVCEIVTGDLFQIALDMEFIAAARQDIPRLCAEVRRLQLERDMWKQRTKVTAMLLIEAQERLNGTVALSGPSRDKAANVAQWIKECFNGWLADVKAMRSLLPARLIEIDTAFSQGDIK